MQRANLENTMLVTMAFSWSDRMLDPIKHAISKSCAAAEFGKILIVTDTPDEEWDDLQSHWIGNDAFKVEIFHVHQLADPEFQDKHIFENMRNDFAISILPKIVLSYLGDLTHTLTIHWDGFIVNPGAWTTDFLSYDYIGAAWPDGVVGNDGFCLRTARLWEAIMQCPKKIYDFGFVAPADVYICRTNYQGRTMMRTWFEQQGIKFAPQSVADKFATEEKPWNGQFGFHGRQCFFEIARRGLYL